MKLSLNKCPFFDSCNITLVSGNNVDSSFDLEILQIVVCVNSNNQIELFIPFIISYDIA